MTKLAKVILKTTSGDEFTCSVHHNVGAGRVELPARLADLIDDAEANGEKYVLVLLDNGFQYPLAIGEDGGYSVDLLAAAKRGFWQEVRLALFLPSKDQRMQYGRFVHTLSASAVIGMAGYLAGKPGWSWGAALNVIGFSVTGVVLFAVGAVLSKGEK
ncbi:MULTISPECIES: hypothetical protein [Cupriavidus]|uniref:hypothetical protein n=1 Tax=Cupriavidus TaxID=106589 RepID=UPI0016046060|nr:MULTISPECIES: hypothetical protein [Cupriavidus]MBB1634982.1 hypothetical protein [Cupriavidus sp. UME77]MCP3018201.1 hypothetical protein [Cupriavidus basilensis]MCY0852464.1 hypothetical protein [Cupriavidus sp. D39]